MFSVMRDRAVTHQRRLLDGFLSADDRQHVSYLGCYVGGIIAVDVVSAVEHDLHGM